jgi:hypothetical protein
LDLGKRNSRTKIWKMYPVLDKKQRLKSGDIIHNFITRQGHEVICQDPQCETVLKTIYISLLGLP